MVEKMFLSGPPDEVIGQLIIGENNTAAVICAVMDDLESDWEKDVGWDAPPTLMTCYRDLPPRELADQMRNNGIDATAMMVKRVPIPTEILQDGIPLFHIINIVAQLLSKDDEKAENLLGNQGPGRLDSALRGVGVLRQQGGLGRDQGRTQEARPAAVAGPEADRGPHPARSGPRRISVHPAAAAGPRPTADVRRHGRSQRSVTPRSWRTPEPPRSWGHDRAADRLADQPDGGHFPVR